MFAYSRMHDCCDEDRSHDPEHGTHSISTRFWTFSTMVFASTSLLLVIVQWLLWTQAVQRYSTDFPTLPGDHRSIERRFTWALHAMPNGTLFPSEAESTPVYVGEPSSLIDQSWDDLIGKRYFLLSDREIEWLHKDHFLPALEPLPEWTQAVSKSGICGGIDIMHSLHCVNSLRKMLDADYYADDEMLLLPGESRRLHLDHCLEQLRQTVLCHADTTPVTLRPIVTKLQGNWKLLTMLGETERLHACRDYKPILHWVRERTNRFARECMIDLCPGEEIDCTPLVMFHFIPPDT